MGMFLSTIWGRSHMNVLPVTPYIGWLKDVQNLRSSAWCIRNAVKEAKCKFRFWILSLPNFVSFTVERADRRRNSVAIFDSTIKRLLLLLREAAVTFFLLATVTAPLITRYKAKFITVLVPYCPAKTVSQCSVNCTYTITPKHCNIACDPILIVIWKH
jgi:hypothetical protein